ncbi:MAG: SRPBCC family protein [Solirubrobacteraceae bacterium]
MEVAVGAPADAVWKALRDPAELRRWFGWDAEGLAAEIEDIFVTHALADDAARTLRFDDIPDRFELEPRGANETVVRLFGQAATDDAYDGMHEGWTTFVAQLRFALERHPGEDRRTLYLTGVAAQPGAQTVMEALGLADLATAPVGDDYEVRGADGAVSLAGQLWARSARQTAITVGGGTGLLVAAELPPDARPPHGGATALITSYGLDDADFQRVRHSWTDWWQSRYSEATATAFPA